MRGKDYATVQKGGGGLAKRDLNRREKVLAYGAVIFILLLVLSPHIGLLLLSLGTIWSFHPCLTVIRWRTMPACGRLAGLYHQHAAFARASPRLAT